MLQGAAQLNVKLARLSKDLDGLAKRVAKDSAGDVALAVRWDIGDLSMSGWTRSKPIEIRGAAFPVRDGKPGSWEIVPAGSVAKGPMRVLESGRNTYNEGQRRLSGFSKFGVRKTKIVGRGGLGTAGKGTWSDAEQLVRQGLPARSSREFRQVLTSIFRRR